MSTIRRSYSPASFAVAFALAFALAFSIAACGRAEQPPPPADFPTIDAPAATASQAPAASRLRSFGKAGPIDESGFYPEFLAFKNRLVRAVETRDAAALVSMLAPDIKVSFGGDAGIDDFRRTWRLDSPESEVWGVLTDILIHGGKFDGPDRFTAPWTFVAPLPDSVDVFSHVIVRAIAAQVYERPDSASPVIGELGYDIVRTHRDATPSGWQAIELTDGTAGFITASQVKSPIDYRAIFERRNGTWMLAMLVAGD